MRKSLLFCFECPRFAIGARSLAESIQVAKFVMSSTRPDRSIENVSTRAETMRRSISCSRASSIASIASQNLRWSSAPGERRSHRPQAVLSHQSEKASFEQGSTTLFSVARAM